MPAPPMYLIRSLFIFLLFGILPIVRSQDESHFTNPSREKDLNWALGDVKVISWETTVPVFNVTIWQQSLVQESAASQGNVYSKIDGTDEVSEFSWVVQLYGADLDFSNVFFFWVNRDGPESFTSPYFNITESKTTTTSSTSAADASTTDAKDTSATNAVNLPSPESSSTSAADEESSSGLQTTGKIALGVGIGIGVPILGSLFALVWLKMRQSNNTNTAQPPAGSDTMHLNKPVMYAQPPRAPSPPKEVNGTDPRDYYPELPSQ